MIIFLALLGASLAQAAPDTEFHFCTLTGTPDANFPASLEIRDRAFKNGADFNSNDVPGPKSFQIVPAGAGIKLSYLIQEKTYVDYKCKDTSNGQLEAGYRGLNCETASPLAGYPTTFDYSERYYLRNEGLPTPIGDGQFMVDIPAFNEAPSLTLGKVSVSPERDYSCVAGRDPARLKNQLTCSTTDIAVAFPRSFKIDPENMPSYYSDDFEIESKMYLARSIDDNGLYLSRTLPDEKASYDCKVKPSTGPGIQTYACTSKKNTPGFPESFEASELDLTKERPETMAFPGGDGKYLVSALGYLADEGVELMRVTPEVSYSCTAPADQALPSALSINSDSNVVKPAGSTPDSAGSSRAENR